MGNVLLKVSCIIFVNCLCKVQSQNVFLFLLYYRLFYADEKAIDQPRVYRSQDPDFTREKILKTILSSRICRHPFFCLQAKKGWMPKYTFSYLY